MNNTVGSNWAQSDLFLAGVVKGNELGTVSADCVYGY